MSEKEKRLARRAMLAALLAALPPPKARAQDMLAPPPAQRPPPRRETIPPSPGKDYEWANGFWRWNYDRWVWVRGRYKVHRPWSYRWIKGHAEGSGAMRKFVPGYYGQPSLNKPKTR